MSMVQPRLLLTVALVVSIVGTAFAQTMADMVDATKTGSKYHRATCASLSKSKIEIALPRLNPSGVCRRTCFR